MYGYTSISYRVRPTATIHATPDQGQVVIDEYIREGDDDFAGSTTLSLFLDAETPEETVAVCDRLIAALVEYRAARLPVVASDTPMAIEDDLPAAEVA